MATMWTQNVNDDHYHLISAPNVKVFTLLANFYFTILLDFVMTKMCTIMSHFVFSLCDILPKSTLKSRYICILYNDIHLYTQPSII